MNTPVSLDLGQALSVSFHRTCRVPRVQGKTNALPASLGAFPLYRVADFKGNVPNDWQTEGHFLPMYPHEAMWMSFHAPKQPVALLVGAGMVNAVTGERLGATLSGGPQNYLAVPPQPWLDGFKPTAGERVFQFVAAQLGSGETAEEQILGTAEFGGLQLGVFKPKVKLVPESQLNEMMLAGGALGGSSASSSRLLRRSAMSMQFSSSTTVSSHAGQNARAMGLGAGGAIQQKIYPDPYLNGRGVDEVWHSEASDKAYVYIVHALDFKSITGADAPPSPITYATYQEQKLPWFGLPDGSWGDVEGGQAIDTLKPVSGDPLEVAAPNPTTSKLWS